MCGIEYLIYLSKILKYNSKKKLYFQIGATFSQSNVSTYVADISVGDWISFCADTMK